MFQVPDYIEQEISIENVMKIDGHLVVAVEYRGTGAGDIRSPILLPFKRPTGSRAESVIFIFENETFVRFLDDQVPLSEQAQDYVLCFCLRSPKLQSPKNACYHLTPFLFRASMEYLFFSNGSRPNNLLSSGTFSHTTDGEQSHGKVSCLNSCIAAFERRGVGHVRVPRL